MSTSPSAAVADPGSGRAGPPTIRVSRGWITKLTIAYLGINIAWAGPAQVLMSPQVERLTEGATWFFSSTAKETNLSIIGFVTGIFALLSTPLWGALSDRTSSRWGRRTPWMAGGTLVVGVSLAATGFAQTLPALLLTWVAMQTAINAVISPLSAAVPDHVPEAQRGLVSGWYGFAYTLAVVAGTGIGTAATAVWPGTLGITMGYLLCAAACVVAMLPFLLTRWETPRRPVDRTPFRIADLVDCYRIDIRRYPDFGWAWLTRFLVTLSTATALFYLFYYLQDEVGLTRDDALTGSGLRVSDGVLILTAVYAVSVFATVVVSGVISDRLGKRRVFVSVSAVFIAVAALLLAVAPGFPVVIVAAVILGLGTGVFTAVDFALVTQVLPEATSNGRDIGIINLAIGLPNVISPVIAALMVNHLGGYAGLYLLAGALSLLAGVLVHRIRGVD